MKKLYVLWLLLAIVGTSYGQTITITDAQTNEPVELVTLSANSKLYVTTNAKGNANISAFKDAEKIEIRSLGYKTVVKSYNELEAEGFSLSLEISNLNLDEVVISGSRWRQNSDDVPSKIISISAKDVALQNPQTAADLLSVSGKVFVQKS